MYGFIPDHILHALAQHSHPTVQKAAIRSLSISGKQRGVRAMLACLRAVGRRPPTIAGEVRLVYDAMGSERLPGKLVRKEGEPVSGNAEADRAYDDAGVVYDFYKQAFGRNSIDDEGMQMISTVDYGQQYDNAFWSGAAMNYGTGDGIIFQSFTSVIDIPGHEISHGVTQYLSNLEYSGESGALNESFSDCMGSCVKQFKLKQTADQADWLIGAGIFTPAIHGKALRSMIAPGSAYDDPQLGGKDPQPDNYANYVQTFEDEGGVHLNSGIPNAAFCRCCLAVGGYSWDKIGKVWYETNGQVPSNCTFRQWAEKTVEVAAQFGPQISNAVWVAWSQVGIELLQ